MVVVVGLMVMLIVMLMFRVAPPYFAANLLALLLVLV
jgi:hypothetical protein